MGQAKKIKSTNLNIFLSFPTLGHCQNLSPPNSRSRIFFFIIEKEKTEKHIQMATQFSRFARAGLYATAGLLGGGAAYLQGVGRYSRASASSGSAAPRPGAGIGQEPSSALEPGSPPGSGVPAGRTVAECPRCSAGFRRMMYACSPPASDAVAAILDGKCPQPVRQVFDVQNRGLFGDPDRSLETYVRKGLECPCVEELVNSPCREAFELSYGCFLRVQAREQNGEVLDKSEELDACRVPFMMMEECIQANKAHFDQKMSESDDRDRMEPGAAEAAA
jgi:hypothetical protein